MRRVKALTRAQSQSVDRLAVAEYGIPGLILMENASRGIAAIVDAIPGSIRVFCGPGNNGGDGFGCARHLVNRGRDVTLVLVADESAFSAESDAGINLRIVRRMGVPIVPLAEAPEAAVSVDALFGTGLTRPLEGPYRDAVDAINGGTGVTVAVDLPSGLDADTGEVLGVAVRADQTATMVAPKVGFGRGAGPEHVGEVRVVDIGAPRELVERVGATA